MHIVTSIAPQIQPSRPDPRRSWDTLVEARALVIARHQLARGVPLAELVGQAVAELLETEGLDDPEVSPVAAQIAGEAIRTLIEAIRREAAREVAARVVARGHA